MLNLALTTDKLAMITSAAGTVDVHASFVDDLADAMTAGKQNTATTTAATTDIVASPAASTVRNVKFLSIRNKDAALSNDITVHYNANATLYQLVKCTLLIGEELVCREGIWFHYDNNGGVYGQALPVATDTAVGGIKIAVQTDMEAASSAVVAVTPARQQYHPGHPKAWVTCGVTANILASYNITSLTDTGTGDVVVTINVDFSSALYAVAIAVQRINSTAAAANARCGTLKTASLAAGSFSMDCWDDTATTNVISDPTTWHAICCGDQA